MEREAALYLLGKVTEALAGAEQQLTHLQAENTQLRAELDEARGADTPAPTDAQGTPPAP